MTKSTKTIRKAAGNLQRAGRNLRQSVKIAKASGDVIAARTRLAATGDQRELARMVPEKIIAFSASGLALAHHATQAALQISHNAASELTAAQTHAAALIRARTPVEAAMIQGNGVLAWWGRMAVRSLAFSESLMRAQYAMGAPVARAAQSNASRLAR